MDAIKFINERNRMCKASKCCSVCFANRHGCIFNYPANNNAKEQVKVLEEWSAAHPVKTRQDLFLEQWPNADTLEDGTLNFSPCSVDRSYRSSLCNNGKCQDCRREFWGKAVE